MVTFLVYFGCAICLLLLIISCLRVGKLASNQGGLIATPIPIFIAYYLLIFVYRPVAILIYGAPTLSDEYISLENSLEAINLGLFSMILYLIPFAIYKYSIMSKDMQCLEKKYEWSTGAVKLFIFVSAYLLFGLWMYGSALNIGYDRLSNPDEFSYYFIFLIFQRFHGLISAVAFYILLNQSFKISNFTRFLIIVAPFLQLACAGRGPFINSIITYGIIYVINKRIKFNLRVLLMVGAWAIVLFLVNFLIAGVRVVLNTKEWQIDDLLLLIFSTSATSSLENTLILGSWDYCVFDTLVRILKHDDNLLWGYTSLSYLAALIPRGVWPDKPYSLGYMPYVTVLHYAGEFFQTGTTYVGTLVGEGYINFGILGVAVYSFLYANIMFFAYKKSVVPEGENNLILYSLLLPLTQNVARGGLDVLINFIVMVAFPFFILRYFFYRPV